MKRWMLTMLVVVAFGTMAMAQDAAPSVTVDQLIAAGQKTLKDAKSVSADIAMEQPMIKMNGTLVSVPPGSMKLTLAGSGEGPMANMKMKMIMHQDMMYNEMAQGNTVMMVQKVDMKKVREAAEKAKLPGELPLAPVNVSDTLTGLQKQGYELKVTGVKDDLATVVADPKGKTQMGQPLQKMTVVVSTKDGMPREVVTGEGASTVKMSNYKFDAEVKPEEFAYKAPEGVEPMDMTDMIIKGIEASAKKTEEPKAEPKVEELKAEPKVEEPKAEPKAEESM